MRLATIGPIVVLMSLICVGSVWSFNNPFASTWRNHYDTACQKLLDATTSAGDCAMCHGSGFSLNPYGSDILAASGTAGTTLEAILAVEALDSDGDGVDNATEIADCTLPGDPNDVTPVRPVTWGVLKTRYR